MATDREQALVNYGNLQAKVDAKFDEIRARQAAGFQCARGCHSCCKPGLTVGPLEAEALRRWLAARPEVVQRLEALERARPHGDARCALLDADGACAVYEARPIVCRSHGAPLEMKVEIGGGTERKQRDVCPLNFGGDVSGLPPGDVINLDTLNTLLTLITHQFGAGAERTELKLDALRRGGQPPIGKPVESP